MHFRGQTQSAWMLQPNRFKRQGIQKLNLYYPTGNGLQKGYFNRGYKKKCSIDLE